MVINWRVMQVEGVVLASIGRRLPEYRTRKDNDQRFVAAGLKDKRMAEGGGGSEALGGGKGAIVK
jgi:hypothetical protein